MRLNRHHLLSTSKSDERGLASLIVTGILVAILSIMAVAFSAQMNRELTNSVDNQIGQAAYDAAESGINDTINYLKTNPTVSATHCNDLLGSGDPLSLASNLSGDSSTQYTCVLVDPTPTEVDYSSIAANSSQVSRVKTTSLAAKMMVSWQATDRTSNVFVPNASTGKLYDQTTWSANHYAPMLQVSIYPVPADTKNVSYAASNTKTFFLYPISVSGNTVTSVDYGTSTTGSIQGVQCGVSDTGTFSGGADYDCNVILTDLPSSDSNGYYYYMRMTPIYGAASIKLKANDASNNALTFSQTQAVIDVTAQSAGAVKRLQARVDISGATGSGQDIASGSDFFPPYALQTADTVCKRIQVPTTGPVYLDSSTSSSYCGNLNLPHMQAPSVTTGSASGITTSGATLNGTVNPNSTNVTSCYFQYGTSTGYGSTVNCSSLPGGGSSNVNVSAAVGSLSAGTTYHFRLVAGSAGGTNYGSDNTFTTTSSGGGGGGGGGGGALPSCYITSTHSGRTAWVVGADCQPNNGNNKIFVKSTQYRYCDWLGNMNDGCGYVATGQVSGTSFTFPNDQWYGDQLWERYDQFNATFEIDGCDANGCSSATSTQSW